MKKMSLLSALLLSFLLLAWCSNNSEPVSWYEAMLNLYNTEWTMTCQFSVNDEENWSLDWIMYIDWENSYIEEHLSYEWESASMYSLVVDWTNYTRWDLYGEWAWISMEATDTTADLLESLKVEDESINFECTAGVQWNRFVIPSNVEFLDYSEIFNMDLGEELSGEIEDEINEEWSELDETLIDEISENEEVVEEEIIAE